MKKMNKINPNYALMPGSYLFAEVGRRVSAFQAAHPEKKILKLGIGDVTRPLPPVCVEALHKAADEMGDASTFQGYPPAQGYDFLINAIKEYEYDARGAQVDADEIFISDGAKSDTANIQELFSADAVVAVPDPVYPVYVDSNAMSGRAGVFENERWSNLVYLPCVAENGFMPEPPSQKVDLIYLCFPNNPTGAMLTRSQLKVWVDYARANDCLLLYDAAYRQYITREDAPRSIYEIEGARDVAIEFCSFSKTAGFTGVRCSWTVVPKSLKVQDASGRPASLNAMWSRRQSTKYNGTAYLIQRAAAAIYTPEGQKQVQENVGYYMENARIIRETMADLGIEASGGVDAPYIWLKCPNGMDSWRFFDYLLSGAGVVGTPGAGFGPSGEGYFRLTSFGSREVTLEATQRIRELLGK
jgi:LL-diaminopimelate aminotransferase